MAPGKPSSARGAARWVGRRPDIVAGVAAGVLYLSLPAVVGLDYRLLAPKGPYQLMWLNLLGAHYRLPIETPKPVSVLLAGLLGSGLAFYVVTCAMVGIGVWASVRLGKRISGSHWPGLIAAVTVFMLRGECIQRILAGGAEPFHVTLVLLTLVALAGGRLRLAALAVFAACLQRPESWSLAFLPAMTALVSRRRFNPLLLLPFAAPLVWMVFDRKMTGDWLYSMHLTSYYRIASGIPTNAGTGNFLGDMLVGLVDLTGDIPFVVGLIGLGIWIWKHAHPRSALAATDGGRSVRPAGHLTMFASLALVLPLVSSWLGSLSGHVLQMGRFQYPSVMLLTLLAASAPFFLFSGRAPRWSALAMSAAIGLSAFAPKEVIRSVRLARIDEVRATAYAPIGGTVKHLVESDSAQIAVVSEYRLDNFARLLGQSNSWKLLSVREVAYGARAIPAATESGVLAYYSGDEINKLCTDSVIRRVILAWPTPAVLDTVALLPDGRGGVWSIKSVP
jgi:hypothetical protein